MPLELLREISNQTLPMTIEDPAKIDKLRVLRASGHVAVLLPATTSEHQFARVLAITSDGWATLKAAQSPETS